ncbi:phospholipase D-like domain-containing protein [Thermodesulfobacteriota bacterium]
MHNKLFVVDNQLAIVGGRNIGNEYFGLSQKYNFRDLDVLVIGPVVEELSHAYDEYWNAKPAYPGSAMSGKATKEDLRLLREANTEYLNNNGKIFASYPMQPKLWEKKLRQLPSRMKVGTAHFLQDAPVSFDGDEHRLSDMLLYLAEPSHRELIIITPYLIPVGTFLEDLAELSSAGIKVKILTGSMGSNNHTAAHSHYKKYRRRILAAGAELYDFKHDPSPAVRDISDVPPIQSKFISLHIKALVGDRKRCFVGSLNLDPRAIEINTENGLYIESSELCGELADQFDGLMTPENAWRVTVNEKNQLSWESSAGIVYMQPARSFWQRIADFFFRLLPIESQL